MKIGDVGRAALKLVAYGVGGFLLLLLGVAVVLAMHEILSLIATG